MRPLALVGNLSRDRVDGGPPRIGGAPFYGAAALRLLGRRAHVFAKCGEADRRAFRRALTALGVPVTLLPAKETAAFTIDYRGESRAFRVDAVGDPWTVEEVRALSAGGWVHVAPLLRSDFPAETLAAIARGRRVLLDAQGLLRPARVGRLKLDAAFDRALLDHIHILKLAEDEASVVGPVEELGVGEVIVTMGSRGCLVYADGELKTVPAREIRVDPTGSGDAFAISYLAARSDGHRPVSAARRATAVVAALLRSRTS